MLPRVRRFVLIFVLVAAGTVMVLVVLGRLQIFTPPSSTADRLTVTLTVLRTISQALAALLGMTIAVIFISAQFGPQSQLVRSGMEIFKDRTALTILSSFAAAIILCIFTLARIDTVLTTRSYWIIDLNIVVGVASVSLVLPLVLSQIENLNPFHLASKLARTITASQIRSYGLVRSDTNSTVLSDYRLRVWGHQHGRDDPLGAFHEVVMAAVNRRDRLLVAAFMRLLLERLATIASVPLSRRPIYPVTRPKKLSVAWRFYRTVLRRPRPVSERISTTIHVLHYFVRRSDNLKKEWGQLDGIRQMYLLNLADFLESLALDRESQASLEAALFAVLHISLNYSAIPRFGEDEALLRYRELIPILDGAGYKKAARMCAEILGLLVNHSSHLPPPLVAEFRARIADPYRGHFEDGINSSLETWAAGPGLADPWKARIT